VESGKFDLEGRKVGRLEGKLVNEISLSEISQTQQTDTSHTSIPPYLHTSNSGAIVITSKNRYNASKYAIEHFGATYIILDDGFQHRKLHRDLDIVLADSEKMFGREKLLPAGPLREGFEAFKRIDKLVIVSKNTDHTRAEKLAKIMGKKMNVPSFVCKTEPDIVYNIKTGEILPKDAEVTAICAIGQPEQFYAFLKDYKIKESVTFDDHHKYEETEIPEGTIITTEKDAVKMKDFTRSDIYALKLKTVIDVDNLLS
jgi:tetraacyldisaccharide 4'-kinase